MVKKQKPEGEAVEEVAVETEKAKNKIEYKRSDYEYRGYSGGISLPDGWERCPGYYDVIRRLKPAPLKTGDKLAKAAPKIESCRNETKKDTFSESWNKPQGGCCC